MSNKKVSVQYCRSTAAADSVNSVNSAINVSSMTGCRTPSRFRKRLSDPNKVSLACLAGVLIFHMQSGPMFARTSNGLEPKIIPVPGGIDAEAGIKQIGRLHLSEGKIVIKQNQIFVFSDAADGFADAELIGAVIESSKISDGNSNTVRGTAIFTKGFSVSAIDDPTVLDIVKGNDGQERIGRIVDVTPTMLRIKTGSSVQAIPVRYIVDVKSRRAFTFALPLVANQSSANVGTVAPAEATAAGTVSPSSAGSPSTPTASQQAKTLITFSPTVAPAAPNMVAPPRSQVQMLHAELTAKHPAKTAIKYAAVTAGLIACFAIPTAVALTCQRPGSTHATGGSSSNSGGN